MPSAHTRLQVWIKNREVVIYTSEKLENNDGGIGSSSLEISLIMQFRLRCPLLKRKYRFGNHLDHLFSQTQPTQKHGKAHQRSDHVGAFRLPFPNLQTRLKPPCSSATPPQAPPGRCSRALSHLYRQNPTIATLTREAEGRLGTHELLARLLRASAFAF
jgi:hypothetical protein